MKTLAILTGLLTAAIVGLLIFLWTQASDPYLKAIQDDPTALAIPTGIFVSAAIGFLGVILAQLVTSNLAQRRDKEKQSSEKKSLAAGLAGELHAICDRLRVHINLIEDRTQLRVDELEHAGHAGQDPQITDFVIGLYPFLQAPIFEANASNLGQIGPELSNDLAFIYQRIALWQNLESKRPHRTLGTYRRSIPILKADHQRFCEAQAKLRQLAGLGPQKAATR